MLAILLALFSARTPTHELIEQQTQTRAVFVETDVARLEDIKAAVRAADEFGGLNVMVNDAGIFRRDDAFSQTMAVNVGGVYMGSKVAAQRMAEADGGCIINISSIGGLKGSPGFTSYLASKGPVRLMSYALASELGPRSIRVNAIHPGAVETAMTTEDIPLVIGEGSESMRQSIPLRRFGRPTDIAGMAVYLASDLAAYVSGESLVVGGGKTNAS